MDSDRLPPPRRPPRPHQAADQFPRPRAGLERFHWEDIAPDIARQLDLERLDPERVRLWALTLSARRIAHRAERGAPPRLLVPPRMRDAALAEVARYEQENRAGRSEPAAPLPAVGSLVPTAWVMAGLVLLHFVVRYGWPWGGPLATLGPGDWLQMGGNDSMGVLLGQTWRLATALTLHADGAHLLGNVCIGGVFLAALCRELGSGPGLALALATGVAGNWLTDLSRGPGHMAIGASTAVFGAVGLLGGLRALRGQKLDVKRAFVPVAGGLALLGMLGSGGENTDLAAHLYGFLAGLPLGAAAGLWINYRGLPGPRAALAMGLGALAVVGGSWWAALDWWF